MTAVGGDLEAISINDVIYPVASEVDVGRMLGGDKNTVESNGDESARLIKTKYPWSITGLLLAVDDKNANDQQNLQDVADLDDFVDVVLFTKSGAKWNGQGQIVGDISWANQKTVASVDLNGQGRLVRQ